MIDPLDDPEREAWRLRTRQKIIAFLPWPLCKDTTSNRAMAKFYAVLGVICLPMLWSVTSSEVRPMMIGTQEIAHPLEPKQIEIPLLDDTENRIGWWKINYPATLPVEGSSLLTISYRPNSNFWGSADGQWAADHTKPTKIAVRFEAKDFTAEPEPCAFDVDVPLLTKEPSLIQDRTWALSVRKDLKPYRKYNIILSFDIQPSSFRNGPYELNGKIPVGNQVSVSVPFNVPLPIETRPVIVMQEVFWTVGRSLIAGLGFVLALPAVTEIVKALIARADKKNNPKPESPGSAAG